MTSGSLFIRKKVAANHISQNEQDVISIYPNSIARADRDGDGDDEDDDGDDDDDDGRCVSGGGQGRAFPDLKPWCAVVSFSCRSMRA